MQLQLRLRKEGRLESFGYRGINMRGLEDELRGVDERPPAGQHWENGCGRRLLGISEPGRTVKRGSSCQARCSGTSRGQRLSFARRSVGMDQELGFSDLHRLVIGQNVVLTCPLQ